MLKPFSYIMILIIASALVSCSDAGSEREKISFEVILDGTYSAISEKRELKIDNDADYQKLMADVYKNLDQMPRIPDVDFKKHNLIAVFIGTRNTGGFLVNIDSITETAKGLNVEVNETKPGKNCMTIDMLTAPFTIVKIPKSEKKPVFKYRETVKDCN